MSIRNKYGTGMIGRHPETHTTYPTNHLAFETDAINVPAVKVSQFGQSEIKDVEQITKADEPPSYSIHGKYPIDFQIFNCGCGCKKRAQAYCYRAGSAVRGLVPPLYACYYV